MAIAAERQGRPGLRASAADALYMSGDKRAVPALLEMAKSGYVTVGGQKASDLRANAAIDFARLAGAEHFAAFKALADKEKRSRACSARRSTGCRWPRTARADLACYGKTLADPSLDARGEGGLRPRLLRRQGRHPAAAGRR